MVFTTFLRSYAKTDNIKFEIYAKNYVQYIDLLVTRHEAQMQATSLQSDRGRQSIS